MRIALASYICKNKDLAFNLGQIKKALDQVRGKVDLLCFGEAFLQGFDCLCWDFEQDKALALEQGSAALDQLRRWSLESGVALLCGYIEREGESLYSSCIVLDQGETVHNYRRISRGWKDYRQSDEHYKEGRDTEPCRLRGRDFQLALCGDLWDFPERFKTEGLLLWPVYVNFSPEQWAQTELQAYAAQAAQVARQALLVNSIDDSPSHGGACWFCQGKVQEQLPFDQEGILVVEL